VRCFKVGAGRGPTYRDALDEALCHGWIDGVRRAIDDVSFSVRFTPRRPGSAWSVVNVRRMRELEAEGVVHAAGRAAFRTRRELPERVPEYDAGAAAFDAAFGTRLRADRRAWRFFEAQPPWYRRTSRAWVMSAKREETRARRFATLIACSAAGRTIPPLTRPGVRSAPARTTAPRARQGTTARSHAARRHR